MSRIFVTGASGFIGGAVARRLSAEWSCTARHLPIVQSVEVAEMGNLADDEQDGIRPHVRFFVNREPVSDLDTALAPGDEVHIFQALSGG